MKLAATYSVSLLHVARIGLGVACSLALAISVPMYGLAAPSQSTINNAVSNYASAEAALNSAQQKLDAISVEYEKISSEVDSLQQEINKMAAQVLTAQAAMLEGRSALALSAAHEYRNSSMSSLITSLVSSQSWQELLRNVDYAGKIMSQHSEEVAQQKELKDTFDQASEKLTSEKNKQEAKLLELNTKRAEASAVVEEAAKYAESSSQQLKSLKAQAEQFIWKSSAPEPEVDPKANTVNRPEVVPPSTPVIPDPKPSTNVGDYKTGTASAYGGFSDKGTPNPGRTASGAVCDDNSTGVAIPMSLPNYRSYFGRTVEIVYNGKTVYGTVNDCGSMGGGARALDLQPGIFKAFGYPDCFAWGLRTVKYRFL